MDDYRSTGSYNKDLVLIKYEERPISERDRARGISLIEVDPEDLPFVVNERGEPAFDAEGNQINIIERDPEPYYRVYNIRTRTFLGFMDGHGLRKRTIARLLSAGCPVYDQVPESLPDDS